MHAAAVQVELRIHDADSLKQKRRVLRGLETGLRRFDVAVAEVGFQDQWRRATIGIAAVSGSSHQLRRVLHAVERWLRSQPEIEVLHVHVGHLVPEE